MICPLCGKHKVQTLTEMSEMTYKGVTVEYSCEYFHCDEDDCDYETGEQMSNNMNRLREILKERGLK